MRPPQPARNSPRPTSSDGCPDRRPKTAPGTMARKGRTKKGANDPDRPVHAIDDGKRPASAPAVPSTSEKSFVVTAPGNDSQDRTENPGLRVLHMLHGGPAGHREQRSPDHGDGQVGPDAPRLGPEWRHRVETGSQSASQNDEKALKIDPDGQQQGDDQEGQTEAPGFRLGDAARRQQAARLVDPVDLQVEDLVESVGKGVQRGRQNGSGQDPQKDSLAPRTPVGNPFRICRETHEGAADHSQRRHQQGKGANEPEVTDDWVRHAAAGALLLSPEGTGNRQRFRAVVNSIGADPFLKGSPGYRKGSRFRRWRRLPPTYCTS